MSILTPSQTKAQLRAGALERRTLITLEVRQRFSERVAEEGLQVAIKWRPKIVSAFHPIRGEPDTLPLLAALSEAGFQTALPVTGTRSMPLVFRAWRPGEPTIPGAMNIPEPPPTAPVVEPELLFVPLSAFDRRGHRIGFGAGHYDRTLAHLRANGRVLAVGVAFAASEIPLAPNEPHDERLDLILTESEWIGEKGSLP
jgi:5-formyltetrahydrofolate cyclo-ligase